MLALPVKQPPWRISLLVTIIIFGLLEWEYATLRSTDSVLLIPLSLSYKYGPIHRFMAERELERRIRREEANSADILFFTASVAHSDDFYRDRGLDAFQRLMDTGIDINGQTSFGHPALHHAVIVNDAQVAAYLLKHCADPGVVTTFSHQEPAQLNALELAFFLEKRFPETDYANVIGVLEDWDIASNCDDRS